MNIYLLSHDAQEKLISKICFKKCKKIIFAPVMLGAFMFLGCAETDCPWMEQQEPVGDQDDQGRDIVLRKIKERDK